MMEASHPRFKRRANWHKRQTHAGADLAVGARSAGLGHQHPPERGLAPSLGLPQSQTQSLQVCCALPGNVSTGNGVVRP